MAGPHSAYPVSTATSTENASTRRNQPRQVNHIALASPHKAPKGARIHIYAGRAQRMRGARVGGAGVTSGGGLCLPGRSSRG